MALSPLSFLLISLLIQISSKNVDAKNPPVNITSHGGPVIEGSFNVNLIWYGNFTSDQRATITDFVASLSPSSNGGGQKSPSVANWWKITGKYSEMENLRLAKLALGQHIDDNYTLGKSLKASDIVRLADREIEFYRINIVLTSTDVAVEGFCTSQCGSHGQFPEVRNGISVYVWVGNPVSQCPGKCAWPFVQSNDAINSSNKPLVPPNGDIGTDSIVIHLAEMLVNVVTNPFGNGFFASPAEAPVEVGSACRGVFGKKAHRGYAGNVLVDPNSGASYNVHGVNKRKYLVPAVFDPTKKSCRMSAASQN